MFAGKPIVPPEACVRVQRVQRPRIGVGATALKDRQRLRRGLPVDGVIAREVCIGCRLARHDRGEIEAIPRRPCTNASARERALSIVEALGEPGHMGGAFGQPEPSTPPFDPDQALDQPLLRRPRRRVLSIEVLAQSLELRR
jgi:hypothetical protein